MAARTAISRRRDFGPRQQEVGHVDARNQQHEHHRAQQHQHGAAHAGARSHPEIPPVRWGGTSDRTGECPAPRSGPSAARSSPSPPSACAGVTPGPRCASTFRKWLPRPPGLAGSSCSGAHSSGGSSSPGGKAKEGGMTPTTVQADPLSRMSRPITPRSPAIGPLPEAVRKHGRLRGIRPVVVTAKAGAPGPG